jgi:hypothetical protein
LVLPRQEHGAASAVSERLHVGVHRWAEGELAIIAYDDIPAASSSRLGTVGS